MDEEERKTERRVGGIEENDMKEVKWVEEEEEIMDCE